MKNKEAEAACVLGERENKDEMPFQTSCHLTARGEKRPPEIRLRSQAREHMPLEKFNQLPS